MIRLSNVRIRVLTLSISPAVNTTVGPERLPSGPSLCLGPGDGHLCLQPGSPPRGPGLLSAGHPALRGQRRDGQQDLHLGQVLGPLGAHHLPAPQHLQGHRRSPGPEHPGDRPRRSPGPLGRQRGSCPASGPLGRPAEGREPARGTLRAQHPAGLQESGRGLRPGQISLRGPLPRHHPEGRLTFILNSS